MTGITFDTLAYSRTLQDAGMPREQADAQKTAIDEMVESRELATKGDIREAEMRLLKWQIGIGAALAAIMAKGFGWLGF